MPITLDIQKLDVGEIVELFVLDASGINGPIQRFHGYAESNTIFWQGEEYAPWAIEATGFARTSEGQQPLPQLSVGNIGMDMSGNPIPGVISSLCAAFDDLVGAKIIRHRTLAKYLDAVNFAGGNPDADPNEAFPQEIWIVEQKSHEDSEQVQFTLSSPIDFSDRMLPARQIVANVCPWLWIGGYRGSYCNYVGSAMFDSDGAPTTDPEKDRCGGRLSDCKIRFASEQGVSADAAVLNYGGFPSSDRIRG